MRLKLIISLIVLLFLILSAFAFVYTNKKQPSVKPVATNNDQKIEVIPTLVPSPTLPVENLLITSNNIDEVINTIKKGHIPETEQALPKQSASINTKAFKIDLKTNVRHQKLVDSININEYPPPEAATLENSEWKAFSYSEGSDMYTKQGFACMIIHPNRFKYSPYISCAYAIDLTKNTLENTKSFMFKTLKTAGIDCEKEKCSVIEEQEEFPLIAYSRDVLYFDDKISRTNDSLLVEQIKKEANSVAEFIKSSGWNVTIEDYTEKEQQWSDDTVISMLVNSDNDLISCRYEITLMNLGIRHMLECNYKNKQLENVQKFYNPYK